MDMGFRFRGFTFWQRIIRLAFLLSIVWQLRSELYIFIIAMWSFFQNGFVLSVQLISVNHKFAVVMVETVGFWADSS